MSHALILTSIFLKGYILNSIRSSEASVCPCIIELCIRNELRRDEEKSKNSFMAKRAYPQKIYCIGIYSS